MNGSVVQKESQELRKCGQRDSHTVKTAARLTSSGRPLDTTEGIADGALISCAASNTESPPSVSRVNVGLSTAGRFRFPLVGVRSEAAGAAGPESLRLSVCNLEGLDKISTPSNPSAIPQVLSFRGVAGPSFRLDFVRPSSSLRSWRANCSSVAVVRSAIRACSTIRSCLASCSAFSFLRRATSASWVARALSYLDRKMEASPLAAVTSDSSADKRA